MPKPYRPLGFWLVCSQVYSPLMCTATRYPCGPAVFEVFEVFETLSVAKLTSGGGLLSQQVGLKYRRIDAGKEQGARTVVPASL